MKTRIITAICLIIVLVPVVLFGSTPFKILMGLVSLCSVFEILSICDRPKAHIYLYPVLSLFMLYTLFCSSSILIDSSAIIIFLLVLFACSMIDSSMNVLRLGYYFTATSLIAFGLRSIYCIRLNYGFHYLILLALVTFGCDTGAYFAGRFFGKHKLNPRLSPKKTIEGSIGGILSGTILAVGYGIIVKISIPTYLLVCTCLLLTITGQIGDLTFSSMKRTFEVKDFSQLLPGHGGILDRFDAFLYNGAVFGLILYYIVSVM